MTNDKQIAFNTILAQAKTTLGRWYQGDPFGYLDCMAEEMTYFSPFEKNRVDGKSAVEALIAPIEGAIHVPKFEILNPRLQLGESLAVFTFHLSEFDEDGAQTSGWKVTENYRHVDDKWRLIHAHFSLIGENQ